MRKRAASVLAGLLMAAGCTKSKPVEPPADFSDAVRGLLADAAVGARGCGSVFDTDSSGKVYAWADATLPATGVADLRAKAISAGWQPVRTDRYALALAGRDNRRLAVRVEGERTRVLLSAASAGLASLTPQQFRVLTMVCEGLLNKQIAFELSVSEATIKAHVTAIFRKLGVRTRTQAALLLQQMESIPGQ